MHSCLRDAVTHLCQLFLLLQLPSFSPQRLLLTGGDSAKPAKAAAAVKENGAKENGEAAVPVTANSANADGPASGTNGAAAAAGEQEVEETPGQLVELKFRAPRAGKYDLSLYCVSGKSLPQTCAPPHAAGYDQGLQTAVPSSAPYWEPTSWQINGAGRPVPVMPALC